MGRKSIYRSDEGRSRMALWYQHFLDRLGHDDIEHVDVDTRYGPTHILAAGPEDAPELWCFHGAMATAPAALAQLPGLLERFRVYFPDTVGQPGRSDERRLDWQGDEHGHWLVDLLDAMQRDSICAFGVSLGGYVVLRGAAVAPERIGRAVLWAPGGLVKPPASAMWGLIGAGLAYAVRPTQRNLERVLSKTFTELDQDYVDYFADSLKHVHPDRRFPKPLADGAIDGWAAPVMLITNEHDTVFPADRLHDRASRLIANLADTRTLEGMKHMPPFDPTTNAPLLDDIRAFVTA
jgi:pimeloyl-ACP methyl ester carboxylesterase